MILSTWNGGLRVVLAVYGKPDDAPRTDQARNDYCAFVSSLLHRYPGVSDVVIWNEPNSQPLLAAAVRPRRDRASRRPTTRRCSPAAGTCSTRPGRT